MLYGFLCGRIPRGNLSIPYNLRYTNMIFSSYFFLFNFLSEVALSY